MEMLVDTNIILRILLNDNPELAKRALIEIGENKIFIPDIVLAEIVYVLTSYYGYPKKELSKLLEFIINENVRLESAEICARALDKYIHSKLSYIDAWLLVYSKMNNTKLLTFDKALKKESDLEE